MSDTGPLFVEFVGVPASGKSTLASALVEDLENEEIQVRTPVTDINQVESRVSRVPLKAAYVLRYLWKRPLRAAGWMRTFQSISDSTIRDTVRTQFNWLFVAGVIHMGWSAEGVTVTDQGLFQAYWSIVLGDPEPPINWIRPLIEKEFNGAELRVILVEADPDVVRRRLSSRSANPSRISVDTKGDYSLKDAMLTYEYVAESLLELGDRDPTVSVLRCTNNEKQDLARNVERIKSTLFSPQ